MLRIMAGEVSDHYLRKASYDKLFIESRDTPTRSDDEEKVVVISLGVRMEGTDIS